MLSERWAKLRKGGICSVKPSVKMAQMISGGRRALEARRLVMFAASRRFWAMARERAS